MSLPSELSPSRLLMWPVCVGLLGGLASALLDILSSSADSWELQLAFMAAGVTALYLFVASLAATLIGAALGKVRGWKEAATVWTVGAPVALAVYTVVFPLVGAYPMPLIWRMGPADRLLLTLASLIGALAGIAALWVETKGGMRRPLLVLAVVSTAALMTAYAGCALFGATVSNRTAATIALITVGAAGLLSARLLAPRIERLAPIFFGACIVILGASSAIQLWWTSYGTSEPVIGAAPPIESVILITVDTLRADSALARPSFQALAADSVVFDHAYSSGPWTPPGLTSILTGVTPAVHGLEYSGAPPLDPAIPTLADYAKEAGYATAAVGENAFIQLFELDRGFEWKRTAPAAKAGRSFGWRLVQKVSDRLIWNPEPERLTDRALGWLEENHSKPFFLWLHYFDPHDPYTPPARFVEPKKVHPLVGTGVDLPIYVQNTNKAYFSKEAIAGVRQLYEWEVDWVDEQLARFLQGLRDLDVYDKSLIVMTSDHGEAFWEYGTAGHGKDLHEGLVRVPLMVKTPYQKVKMHIAEPASNLAVAPTILEMIGLRRDPSLFSAPSLVPRWRDAAQAGAPPVFFALHRNAFHSVGTVWGQHKFIKSLDTGIESGFNLTEDPSEKTSTGSEEIVVPGRLLVDSYLEQAQALKDRLGVVSVEDAGEMNDAAKDRLRGLGYIQ